MYLWGSIACYVISYFHFIHKDPAATLKNALVLQPCQNLTQSSFSIIGAFLMKYMHVKLLICTGASIMIGSIVISIYTKLWYIFFLAFGIIYQVGSGIVFFPTIIYACEWFPERKGLISGLVVGAFGFSQFFFGFITTEIANPDNLATQLPVGGVVGDDHLFPIEVAEKVPQMLKICLIIWTLLSVVACCTISRIPESLG